MKTGTALSELDRAIWHLMWSDDYQVVDRGDDWAELIFRWQVLHHLGYRISREKRHLHRWRQMT